MDGIRALTEDAALVVRERWTVLRVLGEGPLTFLHSMLTQDVETLTPARGALACLLTDKGRVRAEVRVLPLADGSVLLDGEAAAREPLLEGLGRVAPLAGCELVDESDAWSVHSVRGPHASRATSALAPLPDREHEIVARGDALVVRVDWGVPGYDILARGDVPAFDIARATESDLDAARILEARPRFGVDVTEDLLVNETPLLRHAVSFTKGCYPGQESVAKVYNLGASRKRLVALMGAEPLDRGAAIIAGDSEVGTVTSAAGTGALAILRSSVEGGARVRVGDAAATVREI